MTAPTFQPVKLFGRAINLTIGFPNDPTLDVKVQFNEANAQGLDTGGINGLDVEFLIEKSLKPTEPNTCQIKIYNLSQASRESLSGEHFLTVRLEAGYKAGTSQLYFSQARSAWTTREGSDYVTHIESIDTTARPTGVRHTKKPQPGSATGNLTRTFGPKVPISQAFSAIAQAMGIGIGNLNAALAGTNVTVNGGCIVGNAARRMTDLCRSAGLEWSIQDGNLQILNIGQTLATTKAIQIDSSSGLVGSPSVDSQGALSATTLLIPNILPGVALNVDSLFVKGGYRVEKVRFEGATRGTAWYAHFDAARY